MEVLLFSCVEIRILHAFWKNEEMRKYFMGWPNNENKANISATITYIKAKMSSVPNFRKEK